MQGEPIHLVKNDGTQFIWADDISLVYANVLQSNFSKKTYFALSKEFVTWEQVAYDAVALCNSSSKIEIEDLGWSNTPTVFDVSNIMQDFNLVFHAYPHIISHLTWLKETFQQQKK